MKKLRDIKVKIGDKIYFEDGHFELAHNWAKVYANYQEIEDNNGKIIKIERLIQYKTIYETPKQILDNQEKKYLKNILRPFKHRVTSISKLYAFSLNAEFIVFDIAPINEEDEDYTEWAYDDGFALPYFEAGTMYKGMEQGKKYTIKELELF